MSSTYIDWIYFDKPKYNDFFTFKTFSNRTFFKKCLEQSDE